jgi:hypothetical protein
MQKKDSNFLLYENHSIMNTKIISYNWKMVSSEEEQEQENIYIYSLYSGIQGLVIATATTTMTTTKIFVRAILAFFGSLLRQGEHLVLSA